MKLKQLNLWTQHHHISYGKNIVKIYYKNKEKYIKLTDTQMKRFKLYYNTSLDFRTDELPLTKSQLKLEELINDSTNYYKDFCYTLTYNQIKKIYENKDNQLSIDDLINYIDSKDYLNILNHSNLDLNIGITSQDKKYKNVLIDLKNQLIPDWAILDVSIASLFKITKWINKLDVITLQEKIDTVKNIDSSYDNYFGNLETYTTLKKILKVYLDGIILYLYNGEILTYSEFKDKYDKTSDYYKNLKKIDLFEYTWVNSIADIDPEVPELEYRCVSVKDPKDFLNDSLSKLEINLKLVNSYKNNKIIKSNFITELYKYNLVQKELKNIWF